MALQLAVTLLVAGIPIPDVQGDWDVLQVRIHDAWEPCCGGNAFEPGENTWRVQGARVEATFGGRTVRKQLALIPSPAPKPARTFELRYVDHDGRAYSGSYTVTGDRAVLTLHGRAPIPVKPNTEGSRELTITLQRPKPKAPPPRAIVRDQPATTLPAIPVRP